MGRSLAWESTLAELPRFAAFAFQNIPNPPQEHPLQQPGPDSMIQNRNNVNFQKNRNGQVQVVRENPNENQANRQNTGPVFEYCAHIRRHGFPLNNRNTADCRFTLLRLFNNFTDFLCDYSRVMRKHIVLISKITGSVHSDGGTFDDSQEEEAQIRKAHCEFERECHLKLLPRVKRIQLSCKYHIKSIKRLFKSQSKGLLPSETISPVKLDYLRLRSYPMLKNIKELTRKDVNAIHKHMQIIKDIDSRNRRSKGQGQITFDTHAETL